MYQIILLNTKRGVQALKFLSTIENFVNAIHTAKNGGFCSSLNIAFDQRQRNLMPL